MSLHYFIDGYNVIRSDDRMCAGKLNDQRERLLRFIEERRPCGNNRATVVFDGKPGRDWNGWKGPTQIIFSEERDADTEIKDRVDAMDNPATAVVVTNDKAIRIWVRGAGAKIVGCADFLKMGPRSVPKPGSGKPDIATQEDINRQMRRIWKLD
jgi:predicted RNA-binding protein with PIN domain